VKRLNPNFNRMFLQHKGTIKVPQNQAFNENLVNNSYLQNRKNELKKLGATDAQLTVFSTHRAARNTSGNIQIDYLNVDGKTVLYTPKQQTEVFDVWGNFVSFDKPFVRVRYTPEHIKTNGNTKKYTQPPGSGVYAYFTALFQTYLNPHTRTHQSDFSTIYVVEGEFKAFAMCLQGLPTIGLGGINSGAIAKNAAGKTRNDLRTDNTTTTTERTKFIAATAKFLPEIQSFLTTHQVKNVVLVHDADAFDNFKNHKSDTRVLSFIAAVTDTAKACEGLNINFSYVVPKNQEQKGIDDLLLAHHTDTDTTTAILSDLKALNLQSKYFYTYQCLYGFWNDLLNPQRYCFKQMCLYGFWNDLPRIKERFYQSTTRTPDLEITHDGYLSDLKNEAFLYALRNYKKNLIKGGTGSGKTVLSYEIATEWYDTTGYPTIIGAPLVAIIAQQKNGNKNPKFGFCTATDKAPELLAFKDANKIGMFVNYDNLRFVADEFTKMYGGYNLIVDESHQITTAFGYKPDVVRDVLNVAATANKTLFLSATPSLLGLDSFYFIEINRSTPPPTPNIIYQNTNIVSCLVESICTHEPRSGTQTVVLLNNKKHIKKAQLALTNLGYKVEIIYTDNPDTEAYDKLINKSLLDVTTDVILCTEKVATGLNIKKYEAPEPPEPQTDTPDDDTPDDDNTDIFADTEPEILTDVPTKVRMIYCETNVNEAGFVCGFNHTLYTQFVARVRNLETLTDVTIITKELPPPPFERQTAQMYFVSICKNLKQTAKAINEAHPTPEAINYLNFKPINGLMYDTNGKVVVDTLWAAHDAERKAVNYAHITDYFNPDTAVKITTTEHTTEAVKTANKAINELYTEAAVTIHDAILNPEAPEAKQVFSNLYHTTPNKNLKKYVGNNFSIYLGKAFTDTTTEIQNEVSTEALTDIMLFTKLGLSIPDAHKLTFNPDTHKLRCNPKRNEHKAILARYFERDGNGCIIRQYEINAAKNAKEALTKAFAGNTQLTAKQVFKVVRTHKRRCTQNEALLFTKSLFNLKLHTDNKTYWFYSVVCEWNKGTIESYFDVTLC